MRLRLQVEPTDIFIEVNGVRCRVWNGVSEDADQVFLFVARVAVPNNERTELVFGNALEDAPAEPKAEPTPAERAN